MEEVSGLFLACKSRTNCSLGACYGRHPKLVRIQFHLHQQALIIPDRLELFLPHSSELGFFLDKSRFAVLVTRGDSSGSHSRPCPALLYATYLWGDHFRRVCDVAQQRTFESRALRHCTLDLASSTHPDRILHLIQANVLLAYYYLHNARLPEAVYFATGAATLVTSSGLHQSSASKLPMPRDKVEAGERIDAFWNVFALTRTLAILARSTSPSLCTLLEVLGCDADVPWPSESASNEAPQHRESAAASFMQGNDSTHLGGHSVLVLEVKASMLLNEAASLIARWELDGMWRVSTFLI